MIEISLSNVKKSFGFKNILNGFNMEIKTGDKVSLIGENGSGKSTILNIITLYYCQTCKERNRQMNLYYVLNL